MSTVDCAVITNLGHALLGKVLAGKSGIHFTRASVGDGVISEGKSPEELTELVHEIKAGDISGVDNPGSGEVRVSIQVSSLGVFVGFFVKEIGIFATDPDLGEILYAYVGMPDKPQWIRPEGASINTLAIFDVYVAVSRAAEVTAQICPSAMVHISDFESYKTYVETQLSNKADKSVNSTYTFLFQNGFFGTLKYAKNQFGEITMYGDIASAEGAAFLPNHRYILGHLPEGFRPGQNTSVWALAGMRLVGVNAITKNICAVLIRPGGEVELVTTQVENEAIALLNVSYTTDNQEPTQKTSIPLFSGKP